MKNSPENLALKQTLEQCQTHAQGLRDALDDMGARLIPAVLRALGEDVAAMPALDRFSRMEQLGLLASADDWNTLRQIRNQFAHDYPDSAHEQSERLQAAISAAGQLRSALALIIAKLQQRFGE